jgi:hypothetical protein
MTALHYTCENCSWAGSGGPHHAQLHKHRVVGMSVTYATKATP